jgi:hypothetical protein
MQRTPTTKSLPKKTASRTPTLRRRSPATWPIAWPWVSLGMHRQGGGLEPDNAAAPLFR